MRPRFIGARNPFALADAKTGGETAGWVNRSPKKNQGILEEVFGMDFERLFDPAYGSPLFGDRALSLFGDRRAGASGESSEECKNRIDSWRSTKEWPWSHEWDVVSGAYTTRQKYPSMDDPQQGSPLDCWLIAALSSLAWNDRMNATTYINTAMNKIIPLFSNGAVTTFGLQGVKFKVSPDVMITPDVPVDSNGNFACSSSKDKNELWVPFYEKVFATYAFSLLSQSSEKFQLSFAYPPNNPPICYLPEYDPCLVLYHLTGKQRGEYYFNPQDAGNPVTRAGMVSDLQKKFYQLFDSASPAPCKKTNIPMVAFTRCSGDPAITNKPSVCSAPKDSGVNYDNPVLTANHAYSVLGIMDDASKIILRNPAGLPCGSAGAPPVCIDYQTLDFGKDPLFNTPDGKTYPLNGPVKNGVFRMQMNDFVQWFEGMCWVV
jgi:hypothetical protein